MPRLDGREVILGLRPEQIALATAEAMACRAFAPKCRSPSRPAGHPGVRHPQRDQGLLPPGAGCGVQVGDTLNLQFDPARVLLFDAKRRAPALAAPHNVRFKGR
jgi:multiple sugar transport system ATP-binding protein